MDYDGAIEQVSELTDEVNSLEDVIDKLKALVKDAYIEGLIVEDQEWEDKDTDGNADRIQKEFWEKSTTRKRYLFLMINKE